MRLTLHVVGCLGWLSTLCVLLLKIRTEFKALHGQLLGIIKWKETVSGVSHDMAHVQKVQAGIAGRTALWELVCHSNRIQEEWRAIGVKKVSIVLVATTTQTSASYKAEVLAYTGRQ